MPVGKLLNINLLLKKFLTRMFGNDTEDVRLCVSGLNCNLLKRGRLKTFALQPVILHALNF